ncbi:MAG: hypothetical protein JWM93_3558 [Frankiales bacterium]|nr:hypothetical protein [Frankiales bacterium]
MSHADDPRLLISDDRLATQREFVMNAITTKKAPRRGMRAAIVAVGVAAVAMGGVAVASQPAVFTQENGVAAIDGSQLRPAYQGRVLTGAEHAQLESIGKARFGTVNTAGACQGVTVYYDSQDEAYAANNAVTAVLHEARKDPDYDKHPCAAFANFPRLVTE